MFTAKEKYALDGLARLRCTTLGKDIMPCASETLCFGARYKELPRDTLYLGNRKNRTTKLKRKNFLVMKLSLNHCAK